MKNTVQTHKDLRVWKKSIELVTSIYKLTKDFPKEERYGLSMQMRRAAVSIPSNISEGASRNSTREYMQYLYIATGSVSELETQLIISNNLGYSDTSYVEEANIIRMQLTSLINVLREKMLCKSRIL